VLSPNMSCVAVGFGGELRAAGEEFLLVFARAVSMSSGWAAMALPSSAPSNMARLAPSRRTGIRWRRRHRVSRRSVPSVADRRH